MPNATDLIEKITSNTRSIFPAGKFKVWKDYEDFYNSFYKGKGVELANKLKNDNIEYLDVIKIELGENNEDYKKISNRIIGLIIIVLTSEINNQNLIINSLGVTQAEKIKAIKRVSEVQELIFQCNKYYRGKYASTKQEKIEKLCIEMANQIVKDFSLDIPKPKIEFKIQVIPTRPINQRPIIKIPAIPPKGKNKETVQKIGLGIYFIALLGIVLFGSIAAEAIGHSVRNSPEGFVSFLIVFAIVIFIAYQILKKR